jgi:hypothetical protein
MTDTLEFVPTLEGEAAAKIAAHVALANNTEGEIVDLHDFAQTVVLEAIRAEREACAKVLENGSFIHDQAPTKLFATEAAAAIRRRA